MNKEQVRYMKNRILAAINRVHLTKAERKGKTPTEIYYMRVARFKEQNPKVIELLEKETKKETGNEVPKEAGGRRSQPVHQQK